MKNQQLPELQLQQQQQQQSEQDSNLAINSSNVDDFSTTNEFIDFYNQMALSNHANNNHNNLCDSGAFVAMQKPAAIQEGKAITVVTPSQAAVAQARSQLIRNAAERMPTSSRRKQQQQQPSQKMTRPRRRHNTTGNTTA